MSARRISYLSDSPSPNGSNGGRDAGGRFAKGNPGGPGNPHIGKVAAWRRIVAESVSDDDLREVLAALVDRAKAGERWAVCELLDRTLGKAQGTLAADDSGEPIAITIQHVKREVPVSMGQD